jgi:hypothetical protein
MTVSIVSRGLKGSKITRLEKHGEAGHTVAMVAVSWMAKPVVVSSRCRRLRMPPDLPGRGAAGPAAWASAAIASTTPSSGSSRRTRRTRDRVRVWEAMAR